MAVGIGIYISWTLSLMNSYILGEALSTVAWPHICLTAVHLDTIG